jgi:holin-like protein
MHLLRSYFVLLLCQLIGEVVGQGFHLPILGPVLGMAVLATWYIARRKQPGEHIRRASNGLLAWLGLLFVPAGVGIVANLALLRSEWLPISVPLVGSTALTLLTTAYIMQGRNSDVQ